MRCPIKKKMKQCLEFLESMAGDEELWFEAVSVLLFGKVRRTRQREIDFIRSFSPEEVMTSFMIVTFDLCVEEKDGGTEDEGQKYLERLTLVNEVLRAKFASKKETA